MRTFGEFLSEAPRPWRWSMEWAMRDVQRRGILHRGRMYFNQPKESEHAQIMHRIGLQPEQYEAATSYLIDSAGPHYAVQLARPRLVELQRYLEQHETAPEITVEFRRHGRIEGPGVTASTHIMLRVLSELSRLNPVTQMDQIAAYLDRLAGKFHPSVWA